MAQPKFKVGDRVWFIHDGDVENDVVVETHVVKDTAGLLTRYYHIRDYYASGGIPEDRIHATSAALLENIKKQIEEIEK
jgi:hypothetical protein